MESNAVVTLLTKLLETGLLGDWAAIVCLVIAVIFIIQKISSPFQKVFDSLLKKNDIQGVIEKVDRIEKAVQSIENLIDSNTDALKTKIEGSASKINELENVSKNNRLNLDDLRTDIRSIRHVIDDITIQIKSPR
jgi:Mg2+ and Co2+ transporter CorA